MKKFIVSANESGKHVVKATSEEFPKLKTSDLYRALKHKDIRIDGKKVSSDVTVYEGQEVQVWLPDDLFESGKEEVKKKSCYAKVFESDRILIVNKQQGVAVHSGKNTGALNLIDEVRRDLHDPQADLCHRIDMNTGGLVMIAKDKDALEDAIKLFKNNLVIKRYRALVLGVPNEGEAVICEDETVMKEVSAYLEKTSSGNVYIHDVEQPGDLPITSRYRVINTYRGIGPDNMDVSDIEVELVTGRTHQIRAQFAHMGHPVIGDGLYGREKINSYFRAPGGGKVKFQQLFASTLILRKIPKDNCHSNMSGRRFALNPEFGVKL